MSGIAAKLFFLLRRGNAVLHFSPLSNIDIAQSACAYHGSVRWCSIMPKLVGYFDISLIKASMNVLDPSPWKFFKIMNTDAYKESTDDL
jgi:hypothetical protein